MAIVASEKESNLARKLFMVLVFGFVMILIGIAVVIVATFLSANGSAGFGVVIFIGPIPIVFGAGPGVEFLIPIAVVLAFLSFVLLIMMRGRTEKSSS